MGQRDDYASGAMHPDDHFQPIETERLLLRRSKPETPRSRPQRSRGSSLPGMTGPTPQGAGRDRADVEPGSRAARRLVQLSVEELDEPSSVTWDQPGEDDPGVIKVGYDVAERAGPWLGTEAVRALIGYLTRRATIAGHASAANIPSIRLAERGCVWSNGSNACDARCGTGSQITREEYDGLGTEPSGFIPGRGDPRDGDGAWFDLDLQALREPRRHRVPMSPCIQLTNLVPEVMSTNGERST
jgi:hypothetical protein